MPHISKRRKAVAAKVDRNKTYGAMDALKLIKETATAKFDEAVDVAVNLGIDAKKGDQTVRGSVVLPGRNRQEGARGGVRAGRERRQPPRRLERISSAWRTSPSRSRRARWISTW